MILIMVHIDGRIDPKLGARAPGINSPIRSGGPGIAAIAGNLPDIGSGIVDAEVDDRCSILTIRYTGTDIIDVLGDHRRLGIAHSVEGKQAKNK